MTYCFSLKHLQQKPHSVPGQSFKADQQLPFCSAVSAAAVKNLAMAELAESCQWQTGCLQNQCHHFPEEVKTLQNFWIKRYNILHVAGVITEMIHFWLYFYASLFALLPVSFHLIRTYSWPTGAIKTTMAYFASSQTLEDWQTQSCQPAVWK